MDKDFVKTKLRRYPTLENLDLSEFKISLFDNGDPGEFLFFIMGFNVTLEASGTLHYGAKIQYLHTLVHGEVLRQFDTLSAEVGSATSEKLTSIILVLGT